MNKYLLRALFKGKILKEEVITSPDIEQALTDFKEGDKEAREKREHDTSYLAQVFKPYMAEKSPQ